jgi:formate hydrogenlyase transcriptional activator
MLAGTKTAEYNGDYGFTVEAGGGGGMGRSFAKENLPSQSNFTGIVGESASLRRLLHAVETVAPTDASVLILGETGTGKELIAKAVHNLSRRKTRSFVKLNCAAIPAALLEAELFGHERGAFTGAVNHRVGRFELADRGTLFLDEIGDMPLELQPKLLRVLQEHEFERLGSSRTQKTDVRMVAATNQDLLDRVEMGEFRRDLYYRLNVFPVRIPPLRERREDIPLLANHFARKFALRMERGVLSIPDATLNILQDYDYPGNVRELENIIERAVIMSRDDGVLRVEFLELNASSKTRPGGDGRTLQDVERRCILQTLAETNWRIGGSGGAATRLGLKRTTLISKMEKLGISRPSDQLLFA